MTCKTAQFFNAYTIPTTNPGNHFHFLKSHFPITHWVQGKPKRKIGRK